MSEDIGATQVNELDKEVMELDLKNLCRGVWIVKVPNNVCKKWEKAPGNIDVGKLQVCKPAGGPTNISLELTDASVLDADKTGEEVTKYQLGVSTPRPSNMAIFSEEQHHSENKVCLAVEGQIVQKLECRPMQIDDTYINAKKQCFIKKASTGKKVKQLKRFQNQKL
jgi:hypothetical protein